MKNTIIILLIFTGLVSCTENSRAKNWGGTETIQLRENEVITNMTWKETNLWVQTMDTSTGITYFREKSSWGWLEGEILVKPANKPKKTESNWKVENTEMELDTNYFSLFHN